MLKNVELNRRPDAHQQLGFDRDRTSVIYESSQRMVEMKFPRDPNELVAIRAIADGNNDRPVLMLNLNRYVEEAGYPDGRRYRAYIDGLEAFLPKVKATILWRTPVFGQVVGHQKLHEILAAWYPSHQAFLDLPLTDGAEDNYRLRNECVEYAVIHRCSDVGAANLGFRS